MTKHKQRTGEHAASMVILILLACIAIAVAVKGHYYDREQDGVEITGLAPASVPYPPAEVPAVPVRALEPRREPTPASVRETILVSPPLAQNLGAVPRVSTATLAFPRVSTSTLVRLSATSSTLGIPRVSTSTLGLTRLSTATLPVRSATMSAMVPITPTSPTLAVTRTVILKPATPTPHPHTNTHSRTQAAIGHSG